MRDPDRFYRLTAVNGELQAAVRDACDGPFETLGHALDGWLHAARVDYAATDFNAVRRDLENIRAVYGELTWRSPARDFADLNLP